MTDRIGRYLILEEKLFELRMSLPGDSPEEDRLLDEMDVVWFQLSKEERDWMNARKPASKVTTQSGSE